MNSKIYIVIIAVLVVGGLGYFLLQNKSAPVATSTSTEETVVENPTYQHIHSVFKMPDGTILLGAHTGLFKSTDNGKTFARAKITSTDTSVNPDGEFMNFAYDAKNKLLYAGTHDSGLLKSTDYGATWNKADNGIDGHDIHGLAINPLDSNLMYVYSVNKGLYGTKDGAKNWYKIDDGPKNPNVKGYAYMPTLTSMDRNMKKDGTGADIGYLWAGTGGGLVSEFACFCGWTANPAISQSTTVYAIAADPLDKRAMLIAEKDGIYRTTDEAQTFTKTSTGPADVGAIWFDITNPKLVIAATNAGVLYKSEDSGTSWQKN